MTAEPHPDHTDTADGDDETVTRPTMRDMVAAARAQVEQMTELEVRMARNAGVLDPRLRPDIAHSDPAPRIRPPLGAVILDRDGRRAQCIVTPGDRRYATGMLGTRYVFKRSPGCHWCIDEPTGTILPRDQWTGAERVFDVVLHGRDILFSYVEEEWRREDLYEKALIEAVLGVNDLTEEFDLWDEPDHLGRWQILANAFDRGRPPAIPADTDAVL